MINPIDLDDLQELDEEFLDGLRNNVGDEKGVDPNGGNPDVH